jgi:glucose/arabinose dehydrogenase
LRRAAVALVLVALVLAACGDDDATSSSTSSTTTTTTTTARPTTITSAPDGLPAITLTEVARAEQPIALAVRRGTPGFYLAEKGGRVKDPKGDVVLDISKDVSTGNEQGLLGLTFSPDGSTMYISYTNPDGDSRVEAVDPASGARRQVFGIHQPYANHNGGNIAFGPDGLLWFGLGDGGSAGDPHDNAQNPDVLLGKLIRFDPTDPKPAVYALGLRNPWRWSFDRESHDLWIGDVGQDAWEEVDRVPAGTKAGVNLGWNLAEGTHGYHALHPPEGAIDPVYEYGHADGQAVVGGYVYRGSAIDGLRGSYLFTDTYTAHLQALTPQDDGGYTHTTFGVDVPGGLVSSFGEDADGELYVLSLDGGVYRIDAA